jgi:hypothetical protein
LFAIGVLGICGIFPAWADDAGKMAKVEEFMRVSRLERTMTASMSLVIQQVKTGMLEEMGEVKLTPEKQQALEELQGKVERLVIEALGWPRMKENYARLYAETFTEQELDDMLAFYKSESGQSMVSKTPDLMLRAGEIAQDHMSAVVPELQKLVRDFVARAPLPH